MKIVTLFDNGYHKNILLTFEQGAAGMAVDTNQHLIIHRDSALLLDPGGHKIYNALFSEVLSILGKVKLTHLFFSHQDPDIIAAANGWLMTTDAEAYISKLWLRFVPHFGLDRLVESRLHPIPDEGMLLSVHDCDFMLIPAHFLHSAGNFQLYDPVSKILYTGDLGASLGESYLEVRDFERHIQFMEGFHKRYIACQKVLQVWANMARKLDIDIIAPQHGAYFKGREMVDKFISWFEGLKCGVDLIREFPLPSK